MKLGRLPRAHDPRIPHMSAILAGKQLSPPPIAVDWTAGMPAAFGTMLNDKLGDCTCAAFYHARQVWTWHTTGEKTEPDADVVQMYEEACGYKQGDPTTDNGGVEQDVLKYLLNEGAPVGGGRDKLLAFVEIDVTKLDDVKRTIADCGCCYIGFNVPDNLFEQGNAWKDTSSNTIVGGHAVVLVGYDLDGFILISWGQVYRMSFEFFARYVDEAYALGDIDWIDATGKTPGGLTEDEMEEQMQALKC